MGGDIRQEVYIELPKGFETEKTGKLNKSLYGLKSSPKDWNLKFNNVMLKLGFRRSENDYCLYVKIAKAYKLYLLLYVDDVLLAGSSIEEVQQTKSILTREFKVKDLGQMKRYLGISFLRRNECMLLNQTDYLKRVLEKFGMENCKPVATPMEVNFQHEILKRDKSDNEEIETKCRKAIGCLMYAMLCTRPDLSVSISILSRYQACASEELWQALKRVFRYISGTLDFSLTFNCKVFKHCIEGYADSDWAGDRVDRKSTSGYVFKVLGCTVSWSSKKQLSVALSSTESEYVALSSACSEACWLQRLYEDFDIRNDCDGSEGDESRRGKSVIIYEDNQSAIKVSKNPEQHTRMRHIDVRHHFIREKVSEGTVEVKYLPTHEQVADVLTKPLGWVLFGEFRKHLGVIKMQSESR